MKKAQLLAELEETGVVAHSSWTVPELRSLLIEQRQAAAPPKEEDKLKGLSKMTLAQLTEEAKKENIPIPAKATRGLCVC